KLCPADFFMQSYSGGGPQSSARALACSTEVHAANGSYGKTAAAWYMHVRARPIVTCAAASRLNPGLRYRGSELDGVSVPVNTRATFAFLYHLCRWISSKGRTAASEKRKMKVPTRFHMCRICRVMVFTALVLTALPLRVNGQTGTEPELNIGDSDLAGVVT